MNKFFDENAKKKIMAESLSSYLESSVEGILYPATRKIYLPEGVMSFSIDEKSGNQPVFIRNGLCEAFEHKTRRNLIYPEIWKRLHPKLTTWRFVGFKNEDVIEDLLLIFIIKDFALEREVLEAQMQTLRNSPGCEKTRGRLLLLNYSNKSNEFIRKHFQLHKMSMLTVSEMESLRRLDKTLVAEVNSHFFLAESYFLHLGLSRGGVFWGPKTEKWTHGQIRPLSLHHGLEIKTGI